MFSQTNLIPPPLWNACHFVLHFNFVIAHILGKMITAAGFLSKLGADPNETIVLRVEEDIAIKLIEVNIVSAGIAPG